MIRFIEAGESSTIGSNNSKEEYLVLDKEIWKRARKYFAAHKMAELIPVLDENHQLICFAWRDREADREIRMLRELEACECAIRFQDLHPDCTGVTIHGCNELAWNFAQFLIKNGITVNVEGKYWRKLGDWKEHTIPIAHNYEIFAEGVHQKSGDWKQERLRSASVEFECVDVLYEANIKAGYITDAVGDFNELLKILREKKEIVIRGTGTKAQDAYEWLLANGIDICAFQSGREENGRKGLFGRSILKKEEVEEQFHEAVIVECASKHSAWGFGGVDAYDYEGYERNKRYFLLRDYIEVHGNNLVHILNGRNLILVGDNSLCTRAYRWWKQYGVNIGKIEYWDILDEHANKRRSEKYELSENDVCLLVTVQYDSPYNITSEAAGKYSAYIEKLRIYGITDYTDYFSDVMKCISLETETSKFRKKELCPAGIMLGAIMDHCGNTLVKQSLSGHPQIMEIEEYGFFNNNLFNICLRLAEEKANNIISKFQEIYINDTVDNWIPNLFDKKRFYNKLAELLNSDTGFTSQELFVIFHIAYKAGYGIEILNLQDMIIYWEPHHWKREIVREFACWIGDENVKGYILSTVRNRYILAGSRMRGFKRLNLYYGTNEMFRYSCLPRKCYKEWREQIIRFEDLKCNSKEVLSELCKWLEIPFNDVLLETTWHGEKAFYHNITGFDVKPAYNLYEEFFSDFDRMRISMITGSYQRQYGYPCVNCLTFTRRELQEMFLKDFRWFYISKTEEKNVESVWYMQSRIRYLLWLERFSEVMETEVSEEL